jgi:hypothetical protein
MRDEFEAAAEEAADVGLAEAELGLEGSVAEVEDLAGVRLAGEEALLREGDAGDIRDHVFAHAVAAAGVGEEAGGFLGGFDYKGRAIAGSDGFAGAELDAFEHGGAEGVEAFLAGAGEGDLDAFGDGVDVRDEAEPEFGLTFTQIALADDSERHRAT